MSGYMSSISSWLPRLPSVGALRLDQDAFDDAVEWAGEHKRLLLVVGCLAIPTTYYTYTIAGMIRDRRRLNKELEKFQGPSTHWLKGSLHHHPGPNAAGLEKILEWTIQFKTSWKFFWGPLKSGIQVAHPDTVKAVLKTGEPKSGMTKGGIGGYRVLKEWLGLGLLTASNPMWFRNRRLLTPAFHFDILKPYMLVYNEAADVLSEKFAEAAETGEGLEIFSPVSLATLNVILRCAFSYPDDVQRKGKNHPYVNAVIGLATKSVVRLFQPLYYFDLIYYLTKDGREYKKEVNYVHQVAEDIITSRRKEIEKEGPSTKRYRDFLDILLLARDDDGKGLTDLEIRQEVDTFLFEGHDTTASAISWCLYTLAGHPEHQTACREEIDAVLDGRDSPYLEWEDMSNIPFTTQCIKEAMRLHSPVPFVVRENVNPLTVDGITIPPGANIDVNIYALHHNPYVWGDDHRDFKPERFDPDNIKDMDSYAFCPFSAGPRNCIGQNFAMNEIKVEVCRVIQKFELSIDASHKVEYKPELVMRASHGLKLFVKPRPQ